MRFTISSVRIDGMYSVMLAGLLVAGGTAVPRSAKQGPVATLETRALPHVRLPVRRDRLRPPATPSGLLPCWQPLAPIADLPRSTGEVIRYLVDVDGLSVGTVDFKIERHGTYEGRTVTEYRSLFELDPLVATLVPLKGQAASLVPRRVFWPSRAMNRYTLDRNEYEETVSYQSDGRVLASTRSKNGKAKDASRRFGNPAPDFVSAFYMLRRMPEDMDGCSILYGNQRAYTIWMKHEGREKVKTPAGLREADRYLVRYGSERSRRPYEGSVWLGPAPDRLPYRAEVRGTHTLEARIHLFETGY